MPWPIPPPVTSRLQESPTGGEYGRENGKGETEDGEPFPVLLEAATPQRFGSCPQYTTTGRSLSVIIQPLMGNCVFRKTGSSSSRASRHDCFPDSTVPDACAIRRVRESTIRPIAFP